MQHNPTNETGANPNLTHGGQNHGMHPHQHGGVPQHNPQMTAIPNSQAPVSMPENMQSAPQIQQQPIPNAPPVQTTAVPPAPIVTAAAPVAPVESAPEPENNVVVAELISFD